jgi:hypothetical protein
MGTASILIVCIAVATLLQATASIVRSFLKIRNAKKVVLTKKDGQSVTLSANFDKADSKRLAEFSR